MKINEAISLKIDKICKEKNISINVLPEENILVSGIKETDQQDNEYNSVLMKKESDNILITVEKTENQIPEVVGEENSISSEVLIYHTHSNEAYTPLFDGEYVETGAYMTADKSYNINAVGDVIAENIMRNGISVVHDTRNNIAEVYSQSYDISLNTMKENIAENENLNVFIDVHRDSVDDKEFAANDIVEFEGSEYARVLFVVGMGEEYAGEEKPDWEANRDFAQAVSDELNNRIPGISKGIMLKKGRYNQHIGEKSMLVEVGYDANTLWQAINTAAVVGQVIADVIK